MNNEPLLLMDVKEVEGLRRKTFVAEYSNKELSMSLCNLVGMYLEGYGDNEREATLDLENKFKYFRARNLERILSLIFKTIDSGNIVNSKFTIRDCEHHVFQFIFTKDDGEEIIANTFAIRNVQNMFVEDGCTCMIFHTDKSY